MTDAKQKVARWAQQQHNATEIDRQIAALSRRRAELRGELGRLEADICKNGAMHQGFFLTDYGVVLCDRNANVKLRMVETVDVREERLPPQASTVALTPPAIGSTLCGSLKSSAEYTTAPD